MATNSLNSSSEALPASDSDMSADESSGRSNTSVNENRITSLEQENRVLKMELEMFKLRCKTLQEDNKALRQASVSIVRISIIHIMYKFKIIKAKGAHRKPNMFDFTVG